MARDADWLDVRYAPGASMAAHGHERPFFTAVLDGSCEETRGRETLQLRSGSLRLHAAGDVHAVRFGPRGARVLRVEVDVDVPRSCLIDPARAAPLVRRMLSGERGVVEALIAALDEPRAVRPPQWLRRVAEWIEEEHGAPLALRELAARAGVHPVTLAREFRRCYGVTAGEHLRAVRVRAACAALRHTDAPLAEVALSSGFADQPHFARTFARATGTTPSRFRARFR
ncbi:MAG TPA: AraC family transcriptional regulator [Thermoanaerobaculia bacterium]|jgi:AraC-like DNA-binding protein